MLIKCMRRRLAKACAGIMAKGVAFSVHAALICEYNAYAHYEESAKHYYSSASVAICDLRLATFDGFLRPFHRIGSVYYFLRSI